MNDGTEIFVRAKAVLSSSDRITVLSGTVGVLEDDVYIYTNEKYEEKVTLRVRWPVAFKHESTGIHRSEKGQLVHDVSCHVDGLDVEITGVDAQLDSRPRAFRRIEI